MRRALGKAPKSKCRLNPTKQVTPGELLHCKSPNPNTQFSSNHVFSIARVAHHYHSHSSLFRNSPSHFLSTRPRYGPYVSPSVHRDKVWHKNASYLARSSPRELRRKLVSKNEVSFLAGLYACLGTRIEA